MSSLSDCVNSREIVHCGETAVSLGPLSFESLCTVLAEQCDQIRTVAELIMRDNPGAGLGDGLAASALGRAPRLVAAIIATGAGTPEAVDHVMTLPAGFQISALASVVRLTLAGIEQETLALKLSAAIAPLLQKPSGASTH